MSQAEDAPGWEAIDAVLDAAYDGAEPMHWGTIVKWRLGGNDPLDGVSAYDAGDHWHFVSYGMSELYGKESQDPERSGFGFEFTFRLAKQSEEPPVWAISLLQNLARYVWQTGNTFAPDHTMPLNGPIAQGMKTEMQAILFVEDRQLGTIDTPHGRLRFLQVVGVSNEERLDASAWNALAVAELLKAQSPLWVTDVTRSSLHADPHFAKTVAAGIADEGSSAAVTYVPELSWEIHGSQVAITLGAIAIPQLKRVLPGRLLFDKPQMWVSDGAQILVRSTDAEATASEDDGALVLELPDALVGEIAAGLQPVEGRYSFDAITFFVQPTEVRDAEGELVEVIG